MPGLPYCEAAGTGAPAVLAWAPQGALLPPEEAVWTLGGLQAGQGPAASRRAPVPFEGVLVQLNQLNVCVLHHKRIPSDNLSDSMVVPKN